MPDRDRFIDELRKAWRDEKSSALTYSAAAEKEKDPKRKDIFRRMAAEEVKHFRIFGVEHDPGWFRGKAGQCQRLPAFPAVAA